MLSWLACELSLKLINVLCISAVVTLGIATNSSDSALQADANAKHITMYNFILLQFRCFVVEIDFDLETVLQVCNRVLLLLAALTPPCGMAGEKMKFPWLQEKTLYPYCSKLLTRLIYIQFSAVAL
mmetsp:Transcript_19196/g.31959  ORF Transcript_19196/g.31959 Transcript_19196/m.31959 type:complete len:126 (+) Transcript_19196:2436-2813(+)